MGLLIISSSNCIKCFNSYALLDAKRHAMIQAGTIYNKAGCPWLNSSMTSTVQKMASAYPINYNTNTRLLALSALFIIINKNLLYSCACKHLLSSWNCLSDIDLITSYRKHNEMNVPGINMSPKPSI